MPDGVDGVSIIDRIYRFCLSATGKNDIHSRAPLVAE